MLATILTGTAVTNSVCGRVVRHLRGTVLQETQLNSYKVVAVPVITPEGVSWALTDTKNDVIGYRSRR